jgi:acyl-coenzyme A thioesterase PaaI-like protein
VLLPCCECPQRLTRAPWLDTMGSLALSTHGCASLVDTPFVVSIPYSLSSPAPPSMHFSGVSTDIGSTFVRAAGKEGDEIRVRGEVLSVGKTLGFTRVELTDSRDRVVAFGRASFRRVQMPGLTFMVRRRQSSKAADAGDHTLSNADHTKFIGRAANPEVRTAHWLVASPC